VLTKRADRLRKLLTSKLKFAANLKNVWWGVSVEDRKYGLPRVAELRATPARTRFLSVEPLLENIGTIDLKGLDWVIVGGESGHGARPMEKQWVTSVRDQCARAGVRFFFKQWGGVQKSRAGRKLDGRTYDDMPLLDHDEPSRETERAALLQRAQGLAAQFIQTPPGSKSRGRALALV
jgi:protein gp37